MVVTTLHEYGYSAMHCDSTDRTYISLLSGAINCVSHSKGESSALVGPIGSVMWLNCSGCSQEKELVACCKWSPGYFLTIGIVKKMGNYCTKIQSSTEK